MKLSDIAQYVTDKISSNAIDLECYVTTDSLLQNKAGRERAVNLPPQTCTLTRFKKGDILISNIRPYLKKIWRADIDGGCNADVLVLRATNEHSSEYLYAVLLQDAFYSYTMKGAKGSKMPRGDKEQIMRFELPTLSCSEGSVGQLIVDIEHKIAVNREINRNLEAMARQLYDYWFVQFDFPDENGKPYKSSGGKMVWNERLKREIPEGWSVGSFQDICKVNRGASPRPIDDFMDDTNTGMPWLKISDATSTESPYIHLIKESIIPEGIRKSVTVTPETLIVSNSATPGIPKFMGITACVHDGWLVVTKYKDPLKYYLFFFIQDLRNMLVNTASGSVFKNLKTDYLKQAPIIITPEIHLSKFDSIIKPLMAELRNKSVERINLMHQRDELLPLLMNGQVSVMPPEVNCDLSHD